MLGLHTSMKWGRSRPASRGRVHIELDMILITSQPTYCVFGSVCQELVDEGAEHEETERVVHLPAEPRHAEHL